MKKMNAYQFMRRYEHYKAKRNIENFMKWGLDISFETRFRALEFAFLPFYKLMIGLWDDI
ncbi:MAG: hypothetical protein ACTSR3_01280 [Candidatus Helarchaeota archaeon]